MLLTSAVQLSFVERFACSYFRVSCFLFFLLFFYCTTAGEMFLLFNSGEQSVYNVLKRQIPDCCCIQTLIFMT